MSGDMEGLQGMMGTDGPVTANIMAQKQQELEAVIGQIQALARGAGRGGGERLPAGEGDQQDFP